MINKLDLGLKKKVTFVFRLLIFLVITMPLTMNVQGCKSGEDKGKGFVIRAADHGALTGDSIDDTEALRQSLAVMRDGSTLQLDEGIYIVSDGFTIDSLNHISIIGRHSQFLMKGFDRSTGRGDFLLFNFMECRHLTIEGLEVEMDPLAHSEGPILTVNRAEGFFDMVFLPEYRPVTGDEKIEAMLNHFPDGIPHGTFDYIRGKGERINDSVLRVYAPQIGILQPGEIIAIRHQDYFAVAFRFEKCHDVNLADTEVWSAGGGAGAYQCSNLTFRRFNIRLRPGTGRLMSTNADGMHFTNCFGKIAFLDCELTGHGDDAINFHGFFMKISSVSEDGMGLEFDHIARGHLIPEYVSPGDSILVYGPELLPLGEVEVISAGQEGDHAILRTKKLPGGTVTGGYLVNLAWMPEVEITGCNIGRNRARGVLLQSHKVRVENNRFYGSTGAAILASSDIDYWMESGPTRDMIIRNNEIERVNHWGLYQQGAISINTCHGNQFTVLPAGVHTNVVIENNRIKQTNYGGIFVGSTDGLVLKDNHIEDWGKKPGTYPWTDAAVYLENVKNATLSGTTTKGKGRKLVQKNTDGIIIK